MNRNFSLFVALIATILMSSHVSAQSFDTMYARQIGSMLQDQMSALRNDNSLSELQDLADLATAVDVVAAPNLSCCWHNYSENGMNFIYPGDYAILMDRYYDDLKEVDTLNNAIDWVEMGQWLTMSNLNDLKVSLHAVAAKSMDKNAALVIAYANAPIVKNLSVKGVKTLYNILFGALYFAVADEDELSNIRPMHRTNYGGYGGYAANCDLVIDDKPATAEFFISIQDARVVCIVQVADSKEAMTDNIRAARSIRLK